VDLCGLSSWIVPRTTEEWPAPANPSTQLGTEGAKERIRNPIQGMTLIAVWRFTIIPEVTGSTWAFTVTNPFESPKLKLDECIGLKSTIEAKPSVQP
jgi:hypothetical protein